MTDMTTSPLSPRDFHPSLIGPHSFYLTGEDFLRLELYNSAASVTVKVSGRFLDLDGQVTPFEMTLASAGSGALETALTRLGEGWLLNATAYVSSGAPSSSNCFASLTVRRGATGASMELGCLVQDFLTATRRAIYPWHTTAAGSGGSISTLGTARLVTGTTPSAGSEISEAVPVGKTWRLLSVLLYLLPSGVAGTRNVALTIKTSGSVLVGYYLSELNQAASSGRYHLLGPQSYNGNKDSGQYGYGSMPPLLLPAGALIGTQTYGLLGGDQFGAPLLNVEEF